MNPIKDSTDNIDTPQIPNVFDHQVTPTLDLEFNKILNQREVGPQPEIQTTIEPDKKPPEYKRNNTPFREWTVVINGTRLQDQTSIALDALADINDPPFIFHRAGELVKVTYDENETPQLKTINVPMLRGILERCASFVIVDKKNNYTPIAPTLTVVNDLANLGEWNTIEPIAGVVECPIILPDGNIITQKGYDPNTRLYYAPPKNFVLPPIPDKPTKDDIKQSIDLLKEVFFDFPFVNNASRINTIAILMGAVLRPIIPGPVPMALLDKPTMGTGASLIAEVIGRVVTGKGTPMTPSPEDDAAWRKMITSTIARGRIVTIIDNIESKLYVPSLAVVLTCNVWEDRLLGKSEMVTYPNRTVWIATGNNIQLGGDMARRCFWVRMDAGMAKPWVERPRPFRHPELLEWVESSRGEILKAIFILCKSWVLAGRPKPTEKIHKFGGFEKWREIIGGIMEFVGETDFLGNLEQMYLEADTDTPAWEAFFSTWINIWKCDTELTVAAIEERLHKEQDPHQIREGEMRLCDCLPEVLADAWAGKKNFNRVLGKSLSKMNQRVFTNGLKIVKGSKDHHAVQWKVERVFDGAGSYQKQIPST